MSKLTIDPDAKTWDGGDLHPTHLNKILPAEQNLAYSDSNMIKLANLLEQVDQRISLLSSCSCFSSHSFLLLLRQNSLGNHSP